MIKRELRQIVKATHVEGGTEARTMDEWRKAREEKQLFKCVCGYSC